jgi:signal transduction histidine kinase
MNQPQQKKAKDKIEGELEWLHRHVSSLESMLDDKKNCEFEACQAQNGLLMQLLDVEARKQKLMAYEIHDGLAQHLAGALQRFQTLRERKTPEDPESAKTFDAAMNLLCKALQEARQLMSGLQSPLMERFNLATAVGELIKETRELADAEIDYYHDIQTSVLPRALMCAVYRMVQEGLTNACCHSQSNKIRVELTEQDKSIRILVQDWGVGFDPDNVEEGRFGLEGIQARAEMLGGEVVVNSSIGSGTTIFVVVPIPDS